MESKSKRTIIIYGLVLYIIWSLIELLLVKQLEVNGLSGTTLNVIKEILLKSLIWFVPAVFLLRHYNDEAYIDKRTIFSFTKGSLVALPVFLLFTAYHLVNCYVLNGNISLNDTFHAVDILRAAAVGLSEEMVFRGLFLNFALKEDKKWIPVLTNAGLFLIVHFPAWIRQGIFLTQFTSGAFVFIIGLSMIFSWIFIKSKSIAAPAILHAYWDLLCYALY